MGCYRNFKSVIYCTAQNMVNMSEEALREQLKFFQKYTGVDKVYLEPYRDGLMIPEAQLEMLIRVFRENGIEVSGALTTTCEDLSEADAYKQRMGGTYCYSNAAMRDFLVKTVVYTARHFDEFIIDDWFFTTCTCDECRAAKGDRSWEAFRTALLAEVSENLILKKAKEANPNCRVIVKFPNWSESYQEAGYDPWRQRQLFDMIYTGTETRDTAHSDQHLPKYCSWSLMRLMEHYAPGRNGGGWFDPYGCSPMELYSEQAMLTALSRPREICQFCWGSLYKNRVVTPVGLQLEAIDRMLSEAGDCLGVPCYLPPYAQGEDHLEDFLGMLGIPLEPVPEFPKDSKSVFLTVQALKDPEIMEKLEAFLAAGGRAVVSSGFAVGAMDRGFGELSSVRFRGRRFTTDEFIEDGMMAPGSVFSRHRMTFPLLEHRTNVTWALCKGVCGEENYPLLLRDGYGRGQLYILAVPDEYGYLYDLPAEVLRVIRSVFALDVPAYLEGPAQVSLFAYEKDVFALYPYVSGLTRGRTTLVLKGVADALVDLKTGMRMLPARVSPFGDASTAFSLFLQQGEPSFYRVEWNEKREGEPVKKSVASAPHDFGV
ncbi:MAG: hypothetical protein IKP17_02110 [Oscillospiraceae bacterium]|nr:hypothetical protein [Oscillospiraceae bacterium]